MAARIRAIAQASTLATTVVATTAVALTRRERPLTVVGKGDVACIAFSHDGEQLVAATNELGDDVRVVTREGGLVRRIAMPSDWPTSLALLPNGSVVVGCRAVPRPLGVTFIFPGIRTIPSTATVISHPVAAVAASPSSEFIAVAGGESGLALFASSGALVQTWESAFDATCVAFTPDGERIVCGGRRGCARVIHLSDPWPYDETTIRCIGLGERDLVHIAISPDGDQVAAAAGDGPIVVFSLRAPHPVRIEHEGGVVHVAFARTGSWLVTVSARGVIRYFRACDGVLIRTIDTRRACTAAALSPTNDIVAIGGADGSIELWPVPWSGS